MMDFIEWRNWQSHQLKIPSSDIAGAEDQIAPHVSGYINTGWVKHPEFGTIDCVRRVAASLKEIGDAFVEIKGEIYLHTLFSAEAIRIDGSPRTEYIVSFAVARPGADNGNVDAAELIERWKR